MKIKKIARKLFRGLFGSHKMVIANISYINPSKKLGGKRIVITGGGRGLGASMAEKFVKEGASVLIAGRNESVLKSTAERIGCHYLTLDVTDVSSFDIFSFFWSSAFLNLVRPSTTLPKSVWTLAESNNASFN